MSGKHKAGIAAITGALLLAAFGLHLAGLQGLKNDLLVLSTIVAGIPISMKAFQALRQRAFSIELLVTIAVVGALLIGEYVESAAVTFLFVFGAYLEARTLEKTRSSLKALIDMTPLEATVMRDGKPVTIAVEEVEAGDRVLIRSGEKVAVDGTVVAGQALVVEAAITGESTPAAKEPDSKVYSGTMVDSGYLEVTATRVGDDTTFAKIIELIEEAQESKTRTQRFLEKFANVYTPAIVLLSVLVFVFSRNVELALTFLVIACPGALVISAPVSMVAGIGNGARHGVLIKGGDVMEALSKVDAVVFDKTGTLTKGRPEVTDIRPFGWDGNELLRLVAEAELVSEHHLGRTLVKEAQGRGITLEHLARDAEVIKGGGLKAFVEGKQLLIGNRRLMASQATEIPTAVEQYALEREQAGNTAILAAVDGRIAGVFSIADQIRPEARAAIAQLRANGIRKLVMLTGDNRHTARLVGDALGLDVVRAELLPQDKVAAIRSLQQEGYRVAMAGDGINDAPAIAAADIGLAMGEGGTDVAMETADIVLMGDRLDQFSHAHALSKATIRNMKQNTFLALSTVAVLLAGVLLGKVFLASGMLVHEVSVLVVILNAIRLLRFGNERRDDMIGPLATRLPAGQSAR